MSGPPLGPFDRAGVWRLKRLGLPRGQRSGLPTLAVRQGSRWGGAGGLGRSSGTPRRHRRSLRRGQLATVPHPLHDQLAHSGPQTRSALGGNRGPHHLPGFQSRRLRFLGSTPAKPVGASSRIPITIMNTLAALPYTPHTPSSPTPRLKNRLFFKNSTGYIGVAKALKFADFASLSYESGKRTT